MDKDQKQGKSARPSGGLGQMKGGAHGRAHGDMVGVSTRVGIKAMCGVLGTKQRKTRKGRHGCLGLTADTPLITEPALQQWFSKCGSWASTIHITCKTVRNAGNFGARAGNLCAGGPGPR